MLGVFIPWQEGPCGLNSSSTGRALVWLPVFLVATMICESFAGERERKTLETLLASRLDEPHHSLRQDRRRGRLRLGARHVQSGPRLITVNVVHGHGQLIPAPRRNRFHGWPSSACWLPLWPPPPACSLSLRASTVRQAQQTMSLSLMGIMFGAIFGLHALPALWKLWLARTFAGANFLTTVLVGCAVLLALDLLLISIAVARFQRARLILD